MPKRNRPFIALECEVCHHLNYHTAKNPKNTPDRLQMNKYCPVDKRVTVHRETK